MLMFSNNENILKIEESDRRFVIFKAYNFYVEDAEYRKSFFNSVYTALNDPMAVAKFRQELLNYDVDEDYDFQNNRPLTEIYKDLKSHNTHSVIKWAWQFAKDREIHMNTEEIASNHMCMCYNEWLKESYEDSKKVTPSTFGLSIKRHFYINNKWIGFDKVVKRTGSFYVINIPKLLYHIEETLGYIGEI